MTIVTFKQKELINNICWRAEGSFQQKINQSEELLAKLNQMSTTNINEKRVISEING